MLITVNDLELRALDSVTGSLASAYRQQRPRVWRHSCRTARTATSPEKRPDALRRPIL